MFRCFFFLSFFGVNFAFLFLSGRAGSAFFFVSESGADTRGGLVGGGPLVDVHKNAFDRNGMSGPGAPVSLFSLIEVPIKP